MGGGSKGVSKMSSQRQRRRIELLEEVEEDVPMEGK